MSYNKPSSGSTDAGLWVEYALILILVVIVVLAVIPLIEPFLDSEISRLCTQFGLSSCQ